MTDKDFRYEKDGQTIEAFQLTNMSRYQQKDWPEWMDSRWLMTVDEEQWLNYRDKETAIPDLGWICLNEDGTVTVRDALELESWIKVVKDPQPIVYPPADGIPDATVVVPALSIVPAPVSEDVAELSSEIMQAIRLLQKANEVDGDPELPPKAEEALDYLIHAMAKRTNWCDCPPGICSQADEAGCRINSPLVKAGK